VTSSKGPLFTLLGLASAAGAAALLAAGCTSHDEQVPPDIILIMVDTLRADYLRCYGFQGDVSPTVDRLATESVVYDNAIAPSAWTKPAIASLSHRWIR
jgi:hypothetical protein